MGAALAQAGVAEDAYLSVYLIGGAFFSSGGYASLVQVVNEPDEPAGTVPARWRWWSRAAFGVSAVAATLAGGSSPSTVVRPATLPGIWRDSVVVGQGRREAEWQRHLAD